MKEARFWRREGGWVRCELCERRCVIGEGKRGVCGVRENRGGKLYTLVYGKPVAVHVDPIEKKPLFHFLPGSFILSYSTVGCNFKCLYCQNWEISQARPEDYPVPYVPPEKLVEAAEGTVGIAHTYTEPTVYYEYAHDVGVLAKERGLVNVWVTNGYVTEVVLKSLVGVVDAMNIDLKGGEGFYRDVVGGVDVKKVMRNIRRAHELGIHVEVTTLLIPGYNEEFVEEAVDFLARVSRDIPYHITRFHPDYKLTNVPPTPLESLERVYEVAREKLNYVYLGNVPGTEKENTYCPRCGTLLIRRSGFGVVENRIVEGRCPECGAKIAGVWSPPGRRGKE